MSGSTLRGECTRSWCCTVGEGGKGDALVSWEMIGSQSTLTMLWTWDDVSEWDRGAERKVGERRKVGVGMLE